MKNLYSYLSLLSFACLMMILVSCGDAKNDAAKNTEQSVSIENTSNRAGADGRATVTLPDDPNDPKRSYEMYFAHRAAANGPPRIDTQYKPVWTFVTGYEAEILAKNFKYLEEKDSDFSAYSVKAELPEVREYYDESEDTKNPKNGDKYKFTVCVAESWAIQRESSDKPYDGGFRRLE